MKRIKSQKDKTNSPFLDKFLGKTSKMGKSGISGIIAEARTQIQKSPNISLSTLKNTQIKHKQLKNVSFGAADSSQILPRKQKKLQMKLVCSDKRNSIKTTQCSPNLSRESTHSQKPFCQHLVQLQNRRYESSNSISLKKSYFSNMRKLKINRPNFFFQSLLSGDSLRQFEFLSELQDRLKLKN